MNFADEEYVRLYTTDTNTWRMLGFEGQAVLALMLRRFDKFTGVFEFGKHSPERAIVSAIGCPPEMARVGLAAILAEEVWVQLETSFYWPTCPEAQTCRRSDRYRKRQQREREALEQMSREVTSQSDACHENVTPSHASVTEVTMSRQRDQMSRNVTPGQARPGEARPSSDLKSKSDLVGISQSARGLETPTEISDLNSEPQRPKHPAPPPVDRMALAMAPRDPLALELFAAWQTATGKTGARLDGKRAALFQRLAAEGVTVAEVTEACEGDKLDAWARDTAKLSESAILGAAEQREKFSALYRDRSPTDEDLVHPAVRAMCEAEERRKRGLPPVPPPPTETEERSAWGI